jgi:hypothetical protein
VVPADVEEHRKSGGYANLEIGDLVAIFAEGEGSLREAGNRAAHSQVRGAKLTREHIAAAVMDAGDPQGKQLQRIFKYVYDCEASALLADAPA